MAPGETVRSFEAWLAHVESDGCHWDRDEPERAGEPSVEPVELET